MRSTRKTNGKHNIMHRIREVRENEGITIGAMARRMKRTVSELKRQECEDADLRLSEIYRWQSALKVPLMELLAEPGYGVSAEIRHRAGLTRVAKTARSLLRSSRTPATQRLAESLVEQLVEIMPELEEQGAWPDRGVPKAATELGRVAEQVVDSHWFTMDNDYELI